MLPAPLGWFQIRTDSQNYPVSPITLSGFSQELVLSQENYLHKPFDSAG